MSTGKPGIEALLSALGASDWVEKVLGRMGTDAVAPLARLIGREGFGTDLAAVNALREIERGHRKAAVSV